MVVLSRETSDVHNPQGTHPQKIDSAKLTPGVLELRSWTSQIIVSSLLFYFSNGLLKKKSFAVVTIIRIPFLEVSMSFKLLVKYPGHINHIEC